jgi:hypothetical protein
VKDSSFPSCDLGGAGACAFRRQRTESLEEGNQVGLALEDNPLHGQRTQLAQGIISHHLLDWLICHKAHTQTNTYYIQNTKTYLSGGIGIRVKQGIGVRGTFSSRAQKLFLNLKNQRGDIKIKTLFHLCFFEEQSKKPVESYIIRKIDN